MPESESERAASGEPRPRSGGARLGAAGRRLLATLGQPSIWLAALCLFRFFDLERSGKLEPQRVKDTGTYEWVMRGSSLGEALGATRTFGFPLFLGVARHLGPDYSAVPRLQAAAYFLAVVLFGGAVARYSGSSWVGLGAAAPLAFAELFETVRRVQPDFLGCSLTLVAMSFLVLAAARPSRTAYLWALAGFVFLAYQTRPAYLFLIGLMPIIGAALWVSKRGWSLRSLRPWLVRLVVASVVPFLLFATVRWATVGHFGLVSFGGINLIGIAATLLDGRVVEQLPSEVRPAGQAIWRILRQGRRQAVLLPAYDLGGASYRYNRIIWKFSFPAVVLVLQRQAAESAGDPAAAAPREPTLTEVNRAMTDLSLAIIRLRPGMYLEWVRSAFTATTRRVLQNPWIRVPALLLALSLPPLLLAEWLRRPRGGRQPSGGQRPPVWWGPLAGIALLALGYYVCHLLLIVAVEVPIPRYRVATSLYLPGAIIAALVGWWSRILRPTPLGDAD